MVTRLMARQTLANARALSKLPLWGAPWLGLGGGVSLSLAGGSGGVIVVDGGAGFVKVAGGGRGAVMVDAGAGCVVVVAEG